MSLDLSKCGSVKATSERPSRFLNDGRLLWMDGALGRLVECPCPSFGRASKRGARSGRNAQADGRVTYLDLVRDVPAQHALHLVRGIVVAVLLVASGVADGVMLLAVKIPCFAMLYPAAMLGASLGPRL